MKKNLLFTTALLALVLTTALAQNEQDYSNVGQTTLGVGMGINYGGIGLKIGTNLSESIGLFASTGYNLESFGWNLGMMYYIPSAKRTQAYMSAMYGYNAVIVVKGLEELYNKTYYGPSFGFGIKIKSKRKAGNFFDLGLIVPIRSSDFQDGLDAVKNDPRIASLTEPWPVNIYFGYNFKIN